MKFRGSAILMGLAPKAQDRHAKWEVQEPEEGTLRLERLIGNPVQRLH